MKIDIVNDRLNALMEMPEEMAKAAARLRPDLFYSILLGNPTLLQDSKALFHVDHNNDGTAAFDQAALKAAITRMALQQMNGVNLNVDPRFLIVASELAWDAAEFIKSATQIIAGSADRTRGTKNVLADLNLQVRSDGRISNGVTDPVTGTAHAGTATGWFLSADPRTARTIEIGYLAGSGRRPQLRSFNLDRGQWGIGWDIKMDIGAAAIGYRGLQKGDD